MSLQQMNKGGKEAGPRLKLFALSLVVIIVIVAVWAVLVLTSNSLKECYIWQNLGEFYQGYTSMTKLCNSDIECKEFFDAHTDFYKDFYDPSKIKCEETVLVPLNHPQSGTITCQTDNECFSKTIGNNTNSTYFSTAQFKAAQDMLRCEGGICVITKGFVENQERVSDYFKDSYKPPPTPKYGGLL
jgi:hypothetical protein